MDTCQKRAFSETRVLLGFSVSGAATSTHQCSSRRHSSRPGEMAPRGRLVLVVLALSTVTSAHAQRWVRLAREADSAND